MQSDGSDSRVRGPVVSSDLYKARTYALADEVAEDFRKVAEDWVAKSSLRVAERLRIAYLNGLSDGYAQGVLAAHHNQEADDGE
jgi:hypothetical protein